MDEVVAPGTQPAQCSNGLGIAVTGARTADGLGCRLPATHPAARTLRLNVGEVVGTVDPALGGGLRQHDGLDHRVELAEAPLMAPRLCGFRRTLPRLMGRRTCPAVGHRCWEEAGRR